MRIWVFLLGQRYSAAIREEDVYRKLIEDAELAEELGFEGVWIAEHHFVNYSLIPNSLTLAATVAARTSRLRVGTAVVVLPLHNPVRVAEELAMVDQISGGRADIGFGRGYSAYEFGGLGTDIAAAPALFEDNLDVVLSLLSDDDKPRRTGSWSLPARTISPHPTAGIASRLWLAAGSTAGMRRAMERGMGTVVRVGVNGEADVQRLHECFRTACAEHGTDPAVERFGVQVLGRITDTSRDLGSAAADARSLYRVAARMVRPDAPVSAGIVDATGTEPAADVELERVQSGSLIGTEQHFVERVEWLSQLGFTDLSINFRFGDTDTESVHRSMRRAAHLLGLRSHEAAALTTGGEC
jgi:alkanesulfonate monooxygenase SsuD/methylene tetrahydromethanopterin reductase-like flavin-dependent oxidoreductase (luciferase family)